MVAVETPNRAQLSRLVQDDPELMILLERLFDQAGTGTPLAIDVIKSDIATNADNIAINAGGIAANLAATVVNAAGIATNTADIATNVGDIAALDIRVTDLENLGAVAQAERVVLSTYGETVSVADKKKNLNKFGSNLSVGTTFETVSRQQGASINETYVSTNIVGSIVSSSVTDTQTMVVEGHTIDGSGNLTFVVQEATLNGQAEVALPSPMARANRIYVKPSGVFNAPQAAITGTVSVYDNTGGVTSGVPNVDAATKVLLLPGEVQSEKCATSTSATDYWFISTFVGGIGNAGGSASRVTFRIETRDVAGGGVWRPQGRVIVVNVGENAESESFDPLLIVPKSHDIRVVAATDSNTAEVFAELRGVLAVVV